MIICPAPVAVLTEAAKLLEVFDRLWMRVTAVEIPDDPGNPNRIG
jgi:hypothetical protein